MNKRRDLGASSGGEGSLPGRRKRASLAANAGLDNLGAAFDLRSAVGWLEHDQRSRVVVNPDLEVLWANPAARRNLRRPMPVFLDGSKLCFTEEVDPAKCREFIRAADERVQRRALVTGDGEGCSVLSVWSQGAGPARSIYVRIAVSRPMLDLRETGLVQEFGLTRAEGEVAEHLAHLKTPARIAEELGISVHTVRTHVRRIYAKLSIRSQTQFMRVAHTFAWA